MGPCFLQRSKHADGMSASCCSRTSEVIDPGRSRRSSRLHRSGHSRTKQAAVEQHQAETRNHTLDLLDKHQAAGGGSLRTVFENSTHWASPREKADGRIRRVGRHGVRVMLVGGSQMPGTQDPARHRRNQGLALHGMPPHPRPSRDATSNTRGRRGPHSGRSLRARGLGELVGAPQRQGPGTNSQVPSPLLGREQELTSHHPAPRPARMGHGPDGSQARPKGSG